MEGIWMAQGRLFCGVDGGATKTWAVVGDETGRLLGFGAGGPANYHVVGLEFALQSVMTAVNGAVSAAGLRAGDLRAGDLQVGDLSRAAFYLAGDDSPEDHAKLGEALRQALPGGLPFDWDNDSWAALRGGTRKDWGAVVIGGSGTNSAAKGPDGRRAITRGLGRDAGVPGGAGDISREAVFWGFRMDEGFCRKTRLHGEILKALGLPDYDALARRGLEGDLGFLYQSMAAVTPLVFRLAGEGDEKAQQVLIDMGRMMGEQTGAVIERAGIAGLEVEVVLAGSVYRGESPLLIDSLTLHLHRWAPKARPQLPIFQPVIGAYLLAVEAAGIGIGERTYEVLERTLPGFLPQPGPFVPGFES